MTKIPVYFMPGLAASSSIFDNIKLPEETFELIKLDWIQPLKSETLKQYAKRLSHFITKKGAVLIGVSFGGIIVQEIARIIPVRKVIIISSAKCNSEFPLRMRIARFGGLYKLLPTSLLAKVQNLQKVPITNTTIKKKLKLYDRYMVMRDPVYLNWAIKELLLWDRCEPDSDVIHIHGDSDEVFPVKYIKNFTVVKGGTHIMILNKYRWLNKHLPKMILEDKRDTV